jgi:hypothetical protein
MFGITIPPGIDIVRIYALTGKKGKPPCLWEGHPSTEQTTVEASIGNDQRVARWLRQNHLTDGDTATLNLQLDCFSQGRRVESYQAADVTVLLAKHKKKQTTNDTVVLRAFDVTEHIIDGLREMLDERDTVIGRLVERGLKASEPASGAATPTMQEQPKDSLDDLLDKGAKLLTLVQSFRAMRSDS